jgi:predicted transcriptional regulator
MAHYDIPLDLPHAGRLASRIVRLLERHCDEHGIDAPEVLDVSERLDAMLSKYVQEDENPREAEAKAAVTSAAELARQLVRALEAASIRGDRLGQYVRNLFECLELGKEGAEISLRAGESPDSLQRPV